MGIDGLGKIINDHAPAAVSVVSLKSMAGWIVGVDFSIYMMKGSSIGNRHQITNEIGDPIHHLQNLFFQLVALLSAGITPIYFLDGKPPDAKTATLKKRRELAKQAVAKQTPNSINQRSHNWAEAIQLIDLMGVRRIQSIGEAEGEASMLCKLGVIDAVLTVDLDALVFGAARVITSIKTGKAKYIDRSALLRELAFTSDQFTDLCILLGCDYTGTIKGIGAARALAAIQQHGSIEAFLQTRGKGTEVPGCDYRETRPLFSPEYNLINRPQAFQPSDDQLAAVETFLRPKLDAKRLASGLAKIRAARSQ